MKNKVNTEQVCPRQAEIKTQHSC